MNKFALCSITMIVGLAFIPSSRAAVYINDDFNTFANGNLVGQNGWNQLGASSTLPLQVNNGVVVIPGAQAADNQDAWKNIDSGIPQPALGPVLCQETSEFRAIVNGEPRQRNRQRQQWAVPAAFWAAASYRANGLVGRGFPQ